MDEERPVPRINAIATALPAQEIDSRYRAWADNQMHDLRMKRAFERMSARSGIDHRFSVLREEDARFERGSFYNAERFPGTAERMRIYAREAPELALQAIAKLPEVSDVTHLILASCTGFLAPGLDQVVARRLGLDTGVERVSIGFMGCYAGITALRTAAHIVRSRPDARVLVLSVELCSLHLQETADLESLLAMGQFADGAAAAIVSASGEGLALASPLSVALQESGELITWTIGDTGFAMQLSGAVPSRLAEALDDGALTEQLGRTSGGIEQVDAWAVHPGGKSILDAVERGLGLSPDHLRNSREVLRQCGNMSSATVIFVLQRFLEQRPKEGIALAFGPGLAVEGLRFGWIDAD